jgi:poly(3-hydroxyalkanoate) synthetase
MKKVFLSIVLIVAAVAVKAQGNSIDKVTASYIGVKNALAGSNAGLTRSRAKELLRALSAPANSLQPAQQKIFATYADKLKSDSRQIGQATTLAMQRARFETLSNNMFALLSVLKVNSTTVYQQYCPMKKAYWLSEAEEIRNPYYGEKMMECGTVTATLGPVN